MLGHSWLKGFNEVRASKKADRKFSNKLNEVAVTGFMSLYDTFMGTLCPICTKWKEPANAFCKSCYRELPIPMQRALWKRFGSGFEKAFEEGYWFLKNRPDQEQRKLPL